MMYVSKFDGPAAKARWLWWRWVRRYRYEVCHACGRPVGRATPTWWHVPDELWERVEGGPGGIRCAPCFTEDCRALGITVSWAAVVEYDAATLTGRRDLVILAEWQEEMELWRARGGLRFGPPPVPHRDGEQAGLHMQA